MVPDKCPWCDCRVFCEREYGRGYVPVLDLPAIMWECRSKQMSDDVKPVRSQKCIQNVQKEVEELRGEVQRIQIQRDNLIWLLNHEFDERHPIVLRPDWLVVAASLREVESEACDG